MEKNDFAFGKINFIMIGVSMIIVVIGFLMMTGEVSTNEAFNKEVFSSSRITVAPMICLFGFVSVVAGIMYHPKKAKDSVQESGIVEEETIISNTTEVKE